MIDYFVVSNDQNAMNEVNKGLESRKILDQDVVSIETFNQGYIRVWYRKQILDDNRSVAAVTERNKVAEELADAVVEREASIPPVEELKTLAETKKTLEDVSEIEKETDLSQQTLPVEVAKELKEQKGMKVPFTFPEKNKRK